MDLQTSIVEFLEQKPGRTIDTIARELAEDRGDLHQVLQTSTDLFERDAATDTWMLRDTLDEDKAPRPGPFGPAKALLDPTRVLVTISSKATCGEAAAIMLENDYSTLPILDPTNRVIGVVTLESIVTHMHNVSYREINAETLAKSEVHTLRREANFVDGDAFIDSKVNWAEVQHVIVGTAREPLGILTIADVWEKLNDFTEAFVSLFEIERDLRRLIERAAADELDEWLRTFQSHGQHRPKALSECTFSEYLSLIRYKPARAKIEPFLGLIDTFKIDFNEVNAIRNSVMHFKQHQVPHETCVTLKKFRQRVRHAVKAMGNELTPH